MTSSVHQEFVNLIIGIALKGREVAFEFIKKDGTTRIAPHGRSFVAESHAFRFWDREKRGWRCCANDSIVAVHLAGHRWTSPYDLVRALNYGMLNHGPEYTRGAVGPGSSREVSWETARVW